MSVLITKIFTSSLRCISARTVICNTFGDSVPVINKFLFNKNDIFRIRQQVSRSYSNDTILPTSMALDNTSLPLKKKTVHKKTLLEDVSHKEGHYLTLAYATANNYDLKALREGLVNQKLYEPETLKSQDLGDVVVAHAVYSIGHEPREIIFFREGAVVFWNCTELEANNVLDFVRPFEMGSYPNEVVNKEREVMKYEYQVNVKRCSLHESSNCFVLVPNSDNSLERYTFSLLQVHGQVEIIEEIRPLVVPLFLSNSFIVYFATFTSRELQA
ncbi:required for meiotic nuclear division protein 1 homolog isoform X1 [Danaus plexippus]|uniref:required for meiotic nuclear division protein 1 homolog isoform X1 n=1 Tax=Danaus plexippus TaxID=13037 RepID=UPI002AB12E2D|nr:required for meiotic nuclear division protein 1 homolog isoform X1 [Danaus plexippus]XP_061382348.1 required for meiotic nuclear division protein 1 homolog isoform X1 [Danaus plexippus]